MLSQREKHLCPCCGQPRRLAHLLDLYERNFRLLEQLVPELDLPFDQAVSRCERDLPLHLDVLDRDRYTVTFKLTYVFDRNEGPKREPDLIVRVYRDARVIEALKQPQRPHWLGKEQGDPAVGRFLDETWSRNLLLGKWLDYLLEQGHGFGMSARPRLTPVAA